jgi:hypothetical protein
MKSYSPVLASTRTRCLVFVGVDARGAPHRYPRGLRICIYRQMPSRPVIIATRDVLYRMIQLLYLQQGSLMSIIMTKSRCTFSVAEQSPRLKALARSCYVLLREHLDSMIKGRPPSVLCKKIMKFLSHPDNLHSLIPTAACMQRLYRCRGDPRGDIDGENLSKFPRPAPWRRNHVCCGTIRKALEGFRES